MLRHVGASDGLGQAGGKAWPEKAPRHETLVPSRRACFCCNAIERAELTSAALTPLKSRSSYPMPVQSVLPCSAPPLA